MKGWIPALMVAAAALVQSGCGGEQEADAPPELPGTLTVTANGDLFEGGTWTWETYGQLGLSDRNQFVRNWRSDNRLQMALDSVVDPMTGEIVCRINSSDPSYTKWEFYPLQGDTVPRLQPGTDDIADKWRLFYEVALKEEFSEAEIEQAAADSVPEVPTGPDLVSRRRPDAPDVGCRRRRHAPYPTDDRRRGCAGQGHQGPQPTNSTAHAMEAA